MPQLVKIKHNYSLVPDIKTVRGREGERGEGRVRTVVALFRTISKAISDSSSNSDSEIDSEASQDATSSDSADKAISEDEHSQSDHNTEDSELEHQTFLETFKSQNSTN